ncbi:MAG TPA: hypothetical protein VFS24_17785 [Steroidobacteraceae bacterium]|nr:hypothetical protein [Steroidobacteraceae bacterium]
MKYFESVSDIVRIGEAVASRTLPKSDWTHAAHFAAAFWLLSEPGRDAFREMPALIRAYNEATGVANTESSGYHETITLASLRAARAWLDRRSEAPLYACLNDLLTSQFGRSDWLLEYWSRPLLFSAQARRSWVEPDLKRLPF